MCVKAFVDGLAEAPRVVRRLRDPLAPFTPAVQVIAAALEATDACSQVNVADHDAPRLEDRRAILVGDAGSTPIDRDRDELQLADHRPNSFLTPPVAVARPLERDGSSSSQRGFAQASEGLHPLQALLADARDAGLGLRAASMKVEALPRSPWCAWQAPVQMRPWVASGSLQGTLDRGGAREVVLGGEAIDLAAHDVAHRAQRALLVAPGLDEWRGSSSEHDDGRCNDKTSEALLHVVAHVAGRSSQPPRFADCSSALVELVEVVRSRRSALGVGLIKLDLEGVVERRDLRHWTRSDAWSVDPRASRDADQGLAPVVRSFGVVVVLHVILLLLHDLLGRRRIVDEVHRVGEHPLTSFEMSDTKREDRADLGDANLLDPVDAWRRARRRAG